MNKSIILIIAREYPIKHRDILIQSMIPNEFTVNFIVWNRSNEEPNTEVEVHVFERYIQRLRSINFFKSIKEFIQYIDQKILEQKPERIIISHYTLYIPFLIYSKSNYKRSNIVLDVHDLPSFKYNILSRFVLYLEKIIIRKVKNVIIASKYFGEFYKKKNVFLLDNLPPFEPVLKRELYYNKPSNLKIGFVGALRYPKIYKLLIKAVSDTNHELHFFGSGISDDELKVYAKELKADNVFFHGRFKKESIKDIYKLIDISWACYPSDNFNVIHATSNKYLEAIYFKIPTVFSSGTLLADEVDKQGIGFKIKSEELSDIELFLKELNYNTLNKKICTLNKISNLSSSNIKTEFHNYLTKIK